MCHLPPLPPGLFFNAEALLKLAALRRHYFYRFPHGRVHWEGWNCFDFAVVVGSDAVLLLNAVGGGDAAVGPGVIAVARAFRLARVFRLARFGGAVMRQLTQTVMITLPGLINVGSLLVLFFFIYGVVGVQLFATTAFGDALDAHCNFRSIFAAMLTLLRFATGEFSRAFCFYTPAKRATSSRVP